MRSLLALCAGVLALALPLSTSAKANLEAVTPAHGATVWVAPASATAGEPRAATRVAFLHGMCMDAHRTCERVRGLVEPRGALACPTGNAACGGAADWKGEGEEKARHLDQALDAAWSHLKVAPGTGDVLIGFSRGAFVARDVVMERPGRYRALVLLGASMSPDADRLRAAGIRRVVMGCGDFDPARPAMIKATRELTELGIAARFVSLGPIGHALPRDPAVWLGEALDWASQA